MTQEENILFCPLQEVTQSLERKWTLQIIYEIGNHNTIRFGSLQNELKSITSKILSETLKQLEDRNLIHKKQFQENPPRIEYNLTKDGLSLYPIIVDLIIWSISRNSTSVKLCLCDSKPNNVA